MADDDDGLQLNIVYLNNIPPKKKSLDIDEEAFFKENISTNSRFSTNKQYKSKSNETNSVNSNNQNQNRTYNNNSNNNNNNNNNRSNNNYSNNNQNRTNNYNSSSSNQYNKQNQNNNSNNNSSSTNNNQNNNQNNNSNNKKSTFLEKRIAIEQKQKELKESKGPQQHRYNKNNESTTSTTSTTSTSTTSNKFKIAESLTIKDELNRPILENIEPSISKLESHETFSSMNFGSLQLSETLVRNLQGHMKLEKPTHIQEASIPTILKGNDALVKAQTGSGKTLAYLIPVVQKLTEQRVTRSDGCYCVVISPTRELSLQIFEELQKLLKPFYWIVPGLIMGGENRSAEKARIRKGINILVATPGRLLDHLQNTKTFPTQNIKWCILDEADKLLDLGFEKDITTIINILDEKKRANGVPRQNVLVSATLSEGISRLATISLKNPVYVGLDHKTLESGENPFDAAAKEELFAPKQLDQYFVEVESKERLTALVSFIRWKTSNINTDNNNNSSTTNDNNNNNNQHQKMIVFFSSCDSVDFHYHSFTHLKLDKERGLSKSKKEQLRDERKKQIAKQQSTKTFHSGNSDSEDSDSDNDSDNGSNDDSDNTDNEEQQQQESTIKNTRSKTSLFSVPVFKLHGELDQQTRTKTFFEFKNSSNGILLTTDVSARGLDLPSVNWIVQYDPCSDTKDYIHRIGRTARLGNAGSSLLFLLPSERKYIDHLSKFKLTIREMKVTSILQSLFYTSEGQLKKNSKASQLESIVHDLQLLFERFLIYDSKAKELARCAYQSSLRAYATHKMDVKSIFHISHLHLGHVSKSFALRETPTELNKMSAGIKGAKAAKKGDDATLQKQTIDFKMKNYKSVNEFSDGLNGQTLQKSNFHYQSESGTIHNIFQRHFDRNKVNDTDSNADNDGDDKKQKKRRLYDKKIKDNAKKFKSNKSNK